MTAKRIVGALVLLAVGAGLGLGVAAMVGGDDDGGDDATTEDLPVETTTTIERPDEATNPGAAELYDLVTAFGERTLHARYRVEVAGRPEATSVIEIWQKDGKVRQEATIEAGPSANGKVVLLDLEDRVVLCQAPPDGEYTCGLVSEEQATSFEALRTGLLSELGQQDVSVRDATVDGEPLRCFAVEVAQASELCATEDGVLASIESAEGTFRLLDYDTDVDDDVFTPPATPGTGAPT
jgi:hypothetical protein